MKDYEFDNVPLTDRRSLINITVVWTGFVFIVASMMAGGALAVGLTIKEIILVVIIGNTILSILAALTAIIASRTGLSFALLTRYSFGSTGSRISTTFVPIVNVGWYAIQTAILGHTIALVFNLGFVGESFIMISCGLMMGITAWIGYKALSWLSFVSIPAVIFLAISTSIKAIEGVGGLENLLNILPVSSLSLMSGISIVLGTWIFSSVTCIADVMRFAKSERDAVFSAIIGLILGNSLLVILGAITFISAGESDLSAVLLNMGIVVPAFILMTANIWTTNDNNLYSTGLNLSNTFHLEKKYSVALGALIGAALTIFRPYQIDILIGWLIFLSKIVPPLAGVIFADYYISNKMKYLPLKDAKNTIPKWNIISWIAWCIGFLSAMCIPIGFAPLNGLFIALCVYTILISIKSVRSRLILW